MGSKRPAPKPAAASTSAPYVNAALLIVASGYGLWLLVNRGRVSWPPTELLSGITTFAGCLALVGPLVLARRDPSEGGLGELLWMTGGVLVWIFDVSGLLQGGMGSFSWVTPLGSRTMGLTILAVLLAGWRLAGAGGKNWSWTNVTGWALGLFWVGMAVGSFWPGRGTSFAAL